MSQFHIEMPKQKKITSIFEESSSFTRKSFLIPFLDLGKLPFKVVLVHFVV